MLTKRLHEERCGKVANDGLHQTKKDLNTLNQTGHLLSCGGAYISQSSSRGNASKVEYNFLSLPIRESSPVVLKNLQIQEYQESEDLSAQESNEKKEGLKIKSFKYRRKKLGPEQLH